MVEGDLPAMRLHRPLDRPAAVAATAGYGMAAAAFLIA
jgi:hypothetical protein